MPTVSIITPIFNGGAYLPACIASVQGQTFEDYEHIIIDNASTDDGPKIAREAAKRDSRIRFIENPDLPGAGPTRNMGIREAAGRYIAFLDCDDTWRPEKLSRQLNFMQKEKLVFTWTSYEAFDENAKPTRKLIASRDITVKDFLSKRHHIGCLTAIYDTKSLGKHYMNDLPMRQDFCLWYDILVAAETIGLNTGGLSEVLADYRSGGMSSNKRQAARLQWRAYREHIGLGIHSTMLYFISYVVRGVAGRITPTKK